VSSSGVPQQIVGKEALVSSLTPQCPPQAENLVLARVAEATCRRRCMQLLPPI
jgi:hypothetical protein